MKALVLAVLITLLLPASASASVLNITNEYRAQHGLQALTENESLNQSAQTKANDLCDRNYWSHDTPDGQPFHKSLTYKYERAGENLAKGHSTDEQTVQDWAASPGHDKNLKADWVHLGTGYSECGGKHYRVQHFGTPELSFWQSVRPYIKNLMRAI